ncbi:hypothetical protein [Aquaspirillum soli]
MEHYTISQTDTGFHIDGFPDGVKLIGINGPEAKRLADLSLHKEDLEFADGCLEAINQTPADPPITREALWRSAIVHFLKCFGNSARFQLAPDKIYKGEPPEVLMAFNYFKSLRNKHFVHDENSYAQSIPGAVLNDGTKGYKIEKIVCFVALGATLEQNNYSNLKLLIEKAKIWVVSEFDLLCNRLTNNLESENYDELISRDALAYGVPIIEDLQCNRRAP